MPIRRFLAWSFTAEWECRRPLGGTPARAAVASMLDAFFRSGFERPPPSVRRGLTPPTSPADETGILSGDLPRVRSARGGEGTMSAQGPGRASQPPALTS